MIEASFSSLIQMCALTRGEAAAFLGISASYAHKLAGGFRPLTPEQNKALSDLYRRIEVEVARRRRDGISSCRASEAAAIARGWPCAGPLNRAMEIAAILEECGRG